MKTTLVFPFIFLFHLGLAQTKFSEKIGGHVFRMNIPDYMVKTFDLNDAASLQYQNTQKEAYVIVIEDSKEQLEKLGLKYIGPKDFLENFAKDFHVDKEERILGQIAEFKVPPSNFSQAELTWKQDGNEFFMVITVIESPTHFYKVLCWTLAGYKSSLKNDFLIIAKSIKD